MGAIAALVKASLVPGSIPFFCLGLIAGIGLLYGPVSLVKWARRWLVFLLASYAFLSTPLGADLVSGPLVHQFAPIATRQEAKGTTTLVVLSVSSEVYRANGQKVAELGKATAFNALEAARVFRLLQNPDVIVSGGSPDPSDPGPTPSEILSESLVKLGVPAERILAEPRSATTREQAVFVSDLLRARHIREFVLVTEANHMPRAVGAFRALGLDPIPSSPALAVERATGFVNRLRPGLAELRQSDWASYEHMARFYYWLRGWTH
jgi:uncharacterized SAM-binding protein YcdF (DUF218 family)